MKTKFKDTEIGKIPEDYSLKEIRIGTKVFSGFAFKSKDMNNEEGIPVVKIKNIHDREVTLKESQFFPEELVNDKLDKFFLDDRDVLIAMTGQGSVGRVGQIRLNGEKTLLNQRVGKFIVDEKKLDRDYLYFVISSPRYEKILFDTGSGSGQPNLSPSQILSVEIPLPRIEIQMKISEILRSLNDRIYLNKQMNKTLEAIAQALFKHWFVDFEFPNEEGKPYKSSGGEMVFNEELGKEIPKGWEVGKLGDFINITSGKRPKQKSEVRDSVFNVPLVGASSVMGFVMEPLFKEPVLIIGRVGTHGVVQRFTTPTYPSDNTLIIRSPFYEYVYQVLKRIDYASLNVGSTQPLITQSSIKNYTINIPKENILSNFENTVSVLFAKGNANNHEIENLSKIRDTLLPKLMSGVVRINI